MKQVLLLFPHFQSRKWTHLDILITSQGFIARLRRISMRIDSQKGRKKNSTSFKGIASIDRVLVAKCCNTVPFINAIQIWM